MMLQMSWRRFKAREGFTSLVKSFSVRDGFHEVSDCLDLVMIRMHWDYLELLMILHDARGSSASSSGPPRGNYG